MIASIYNFIIGLFETLRDFLLDLPILIFEKILNGLKSLLTSIPTPDFISNAQTYMNSIPPDVMYYLTILEIPFGLGLIFSALVIRFIIKLIPTVG